MYTVEDHFSCQYVWAKCYTVSVSFLRLLLLLAFHLLQDGIEYGE